MQTHVPSLRKVDRNLPGLAWPLDPDLDQILSKGNSRESWAQRAEFKSVYDLPANNDKLYSTHIYFLFMKLIQRVES